MPIQGQPQIIPDPEIELVEGKNVSIIGLRTNNSRIPETNSRDPETEPGSVETELRVHRIHDALENKITECPSQPGGHPQGGAGG